MKTDQEKEELFYMKYTRGYLVYIKDDSGRRVKVTWKEFFESYDPEKQLNFQDLVELIPIDEKYEAKRDQMEIDQLIEKENLPVAEQLDMFQEYGDVVDYDNLHDQAGKRKEITDDDWNQ